LGIYVRNWINMLVSILKKLWWDIATSECFKTKQSFEIFYPALIQGTYMMWQIAQGFDHVKMTKLTTCSNIHETCYFFEPCVV